MHESKDLFLEKPEISATKKAESLLLLIVSGIMQ